MPIAGPRLLGRQEPTHLLVPSAYSNAAAEMIDLYESLGPTLDPWQKTSLHAASGEDRLGAWVAFLIAILVQRQNGKGGITEARQLGGLFLFGDRKLIHSAHRVDTAMGAYQRLKNLIDSSDDLTRRIKRMIDSSGEASIETMSGQVLEFRTRGRDGGRGLSAQTLFLDEALEMALEVMADLLPTLLAIDNAQVWLTSTPPKFDGQYLTDLRRRVLAGVDVERIAYLEWSNPAGADLSDPKVLAAVNPALGIRLTLEKLKDLLRELGPELFARECGGIWPVSSDSEWLVISAAAWSDAQVAATSQIVGRPALGVYVPPDRSYAAIAAAGAREGGGRQIEVTGDAEEDLVDHRPGTRWIVPRLLQLEKHEPSVIVVDDKAVAEECEEAGLIVHRSSLGDVVTGCGLLYDGVAGPDVAARDVYHIGQKALTDAAKGATKRNVGGSWAWDRRAAVVDIAPIGAASLALFGHATPRVQRPVVDGEMWGFYA
jgi:hypothetical protein